MSQPERTRPDNPVEDTAINVYRPVHPEDPHHPPSDGSATAENPGSEIDQEIMRSADSVLSTSDGGDTPEAQLDFRAFHDQLTSLPNRALFLDRLEHALSRARRRNERIAIILLDLDRFHLINDTLGPVAGDLLLMEVSHRLRHCLRLDDTVCRVGGDGFAVLLEGDSTDAGVKYVAERILKRFQAPFQIQEEEVFSSASMGIVTSPPNITMDQIIRDAGTALHQAKERGGGRYVIYQPQLSQQAGERLRFETELRRAIERNQFQVHFQPIFLMDTRRVIGLEALVRWQHPRFGLMPPDEFIPLQEQIGLIEPFTYWLLREAMIACMDWHRAGFRVTVSANLSPYSLHEPGFAGQVALLLEETGLPPSFLKLEITEGAVMIDPARAMSVLDELKAMELRLCVDDFGTGYSSLTYLKQLPVQEVKIDKSFIIGLDHQDEDDAAIVRATIDLAHNLRKKVVAEGVESLETWNLLSTLGCDAAQGFLMARPMPAQDVIPWLTAPLWAGDADPTDPDAVLAPKDHSTNG